MQKKYFLSILVFGFLMTQITFAQNPVIKDIGMSDPHVRVFNDTIFLYTGHDSSPEDKTWVMKDWMVFSSTDLVNWEKRGTISPKDNYMDDNSTDCWASDAASRNGKYYFYFSDKTRGIGVMTADSPAGPFKDALGKPIVSPMHDPTILIDDDADRSPYLVYGHKEGGGYRIARLNNDMISLAEEPKPIEIKGRDWDVTPTWMDKNYIFKHNGIYYLSWGNNYAVSKYVYGPYECAGKVGTGHSLGPFAHGSFFWWKGQFYHTWCYYLNMRYKYRESIITYCHFTNDGKIVTDTQFLDSHFDYGVGRYNASWEKIEAEWFYDKSPGAIKKGTIEEGFVVGNLKNNDWIKFPNVKFEKVFKQFSAAISDVGENGKIEIRIDNPKGKKAGEIIFKKSEQTENQVTYGALKPVTGEKDIYLVMKGNKKLYFNIDWISFIE